MTDPIETLNDRLGRWAAQRPNDLAIAFLKRGEVPDAALTFGELHAKAVLIANALIAQGLRGQPVLLAFPAGLDFVAALFGCFLSGVIAVPVPYPLQSSAFARLVHIAKAAQARAVVVAAQDLIGFRDAFAPISNLDVVPLDSLQMASGPQTLPTPVARELPAFLQFTSGSTGNPKGVIITHANIAANMAMIQTAFGHDHETRFVSWLPAFHDMGLVGKVLQPIWLGVPVWLMSPYAFMQRPIRWLNAISTHRATTSGAPNFAYDLISKHLNPQALQNLDLSCWKVAFCGAEPVRAASLTRFADLLAPTGFDRRALFPCYGMAEATLFVSGGPHGAGVMADGPNSETSCGKVAYPAGLRVVDPSTLQDVATGQRGEILLRGPHLTAGYWQNKAANLSGFTTDAAGQSWLRTGDLGILAQNALYVVGRLKDQVIVRGVNYSAEEIESHMCQSHPSLQGSPAAVVNLGNDAVGMIELRTRPGVFDDFAALADGANGAVTRSFGLRLDRILFLKWGSLPRTTSGKIRRHVAFETIHLATDLLHDAVYRT